jgi:hypothetical protein
VSPLAHAGVALALFVPLAAVFGPAAGAVAGILLYFGREGAEAQRATGRPKADVWYVPFTPWVWPRQMVLDWLAPTAAVLVAALLWGRAWRAVVSWLL